MVKIYNFLIPACVIMIILAFFLPWVIVGSEQVGAVSKLLTGKRQETVDSISAFRVPILANSSEARLMITIIKIFSPDVKDADKKSFLIWSIPLLAVIIFLLSYFFGKNRWLNLACGIVSSAIFFIAVYKIKTTDLDKMILQISMGSGLWLTLWAYLIIGLTCLFNFFQLIRARAK